MTIADIGAETGAAHSHHPVEYTQNQLKTSTMVLVLLLIVVIAGALMVFKGILGGLILSAVIATWVILAFLVVMTAGA